MESAIEIPQAMRQTIEKIASSERMTFAETVRDLLELGITSYEENADPFGAPTLNYPIDEEDREIDEA